MYSEGFTISETMALNDRPLSSKSLGFVWREIGEETEARTLEGGGFLQTSFFQVTYESKYECRSLLTKTWRSSSLVQVSSCSVVIALFASQFVTKHAANGTS